MADSSGTTLMDLISSDPTSVPPPSSTPAQASTASHQRSASPFSKPVAAPTTTDRKSKRSTLMQIQSDAVSAARAAVRIPHKHKKKARLYTMMNLHCKPVSYAQLARSIHELAASSDQKKSQRQLVHHVFPKLAVYNSVDPSLAPSLLMLGQQCEDRTILRYVYYYLARILPDTGAQGLTPGGGIPTPNWDALADIDAVGGVTRADVVPRILDRLSSEALNPDIELDVPSDDSALGPHGGLNFLWWQAVQSLILLTSLIPVLKLNEKNFSIKKSDLHLRLLFSVHARRLQALKALTYASNSSEILQKLYEIVFGILDKVADTPDKRKKGIFGAKGGDKEIARRDVERSLKQLHTPVNFPGFIDLQHLPAHTLTEIFSKQCIPYPFNVNEQSIIRSNLQYAAISALRRLPLDPGNPIFLHRAVQGVSFADPVAVRHSLEIISHLATKDPYAVAMALGELENIEGRFQILTRDMETVNKLMNMLIKLYDKPLMNTPGFEGKFIKKLEENTELEENIELLDGGGAVVVEPKISFIISLLREATTLRSKVTGTCNSRLWNSSANDNRKLAQPGGALQDVLHLHDVLARVALARLCHAISRAKSLDERPDIKSQFTALLYQLLLDPSDRVCFEAILCVLGKSDTADRTEERALGWYRLTREVLKAPEAPSVKDKDKSSKTRRPQLLIKLVMRRLLCSFNTNIQLYVFYKCFQSLLVYQQNFINFLFIRYRLESSFRSFSRPVLHAAARIVQEMGKSRAAAFALGLHDIDEGGDVNTFAENNEQEDGKSQLEGNWLEALEYTCYCFFFFASFAPLLGLRRIPSMSNGAGNKETVASLLASLMEVVRTTVACECVYVRAMVIKALIWMQSPQETFAELESMIASELSDPAWSAALLNDILLTLHARFKATPDMAVTLLEIARVFATKVPGKIDADVLQLLWKVGVKGPKRSRNGHGFKSSDGCPTDHITLQGAAWQQRLGGNDGINCQRVWKFETCLVGAGPDGKHTALEAVTIVLDLPPPQPGSMSGLTSIDRVFASDPKSALALQRLVQAAVWFLGENANYAATEYAWESATPPGTALMMLDADKMVAAASSRNPTLANALTRLQRCAFIGSWEVRIIAAQALTTMAIRSGEPYRIQIYEFLHALAEGGVQSQFSDMHISNGEDQGASGTGLGSLLSPMLKVLDDMYSAQDDLIKEMRNHDNAKKEWTDEELKKLYETHERLLDLVSLFCYVPRSKYLPLGPTSAKLIDIYRNRHNITASTGMRDPAVATGISELIYEATKPAPAEPDNIDDDLVNAWATGLADDGLWGNNAPAMNRVNEFLAGAGTDAPDVDENIISRPSMSYDDMWAKTLLETAEVDIFICFMQDDDGRSSGSSSPDSVGSVETSISSHFGGMTYPSLFSSKPSTYGSSQPTEKSSSTSRQRKASAGSSSYEGYGSPISEEPPPYSSPVHHQRYESFENPLAGQGSSSFDSHEEERGNSQSGSALYDFTAGGDDELNLTAGEEVEIEYEVDGWFYVKKKRPGRDGKMAGLVPVLYVSQS
ncbi:Armadillo-type fold [Cynara cardunculus var. scolymus]|uniref:Armadillo-type fold n=1 Tax=Cynara cardunculus var. scolymus TaxID=59895 RepID=A0A103XXE9_CYNCS|nr:Armadillo-type fold [Cynara cardunculus var. scolymus]